jgi:aquaporin Z
MNKTMKRYLAECLGTAILVLIGCGSIAIGGLSGNPIINVAAIGLAFGLAVMAVAYSLGPISGAHINPAVTAAMWTAGRMKSDEAIWYIAAQLIGALIGAGVLWLILQGRAGGLDLTKTSLGQNGFGPGVLGQYGMASAAGVELIATFIFTMVILAVTAGRGGNPLAGLVIGLTLLSLHLPFFNVTGLSVNPARSFGPAVFVGGAAVTQLWLFLIVPMIGGAIAGWLFREKILSA